MCSTVKLRSSPEWYIYCTVNLIGQLKSPSHLHRFIFIAFVPTSILSVVRYLCVCVGGGGGGGGGACVGVVGVFLCVGVGVCCDVCVCVCMCKRGRGTIYNVFNGPP